MPCDVVLECIILFIILYYQAKIVMINKNKILKYLTTDLFVLTYFFCTHADIDMRFCMTCRYCDVGTPMSHRTNSA
jgi:predicted transporter